MLLKYQIKTENRIVWRFYFDERLFWWHYHETKYYAWQYKYINKTPASLYFLFFGLIFIISQNVISISNFAMQQSLYEGDT